MQLPSQIAEHFRSVHTGNNWTAVNLKETLSDITLQEAMTPVGNLNTIARLVFHINYYVSAVLQVLRGAPLNASDKLSFDHPPLGTSAEWQQLVAKTLEDAEAFAAEIEKFPASRLGEMFENPDYGNYYRNFHGIVEHTHYHLGQIAVIKKLLREKA